MSRSDINWDAHVSAYKSSGLSLAEYCVAADVKITTLRHHVYKRRAGRLKAGGRSRKSLFQEVPLGSELIVTRMPTGELSLRGFDAADLPILIRAWSHAVHG